MVGTEDTASYTKSFEVLQRLLEGLYREKPDNPVKFMYDAVCSLTERPQSRSNSMRPSTSSRPKPPKPESDGGETKGGAEGTAGVEVEEEMDETREQVVKIFLSSTFADMFSEREMVVKKTIPRLQSYFNQKLVSVRILPIDLRWGVEAGSDAATTMEACLGEIERCRQLQGGDPVFLSFLSERYGWVPQPDHVPPSIRSKYGWRDGSSITEMEIVRGALVNEVGDERANNGVNPNACFMFRDPSFLSTLDPKLTDARGEDFLSRYTTASQQERDKLALLKKSIESKVPSHQLLRYKPKFDGSLLNFNVDSTRTSSAPATLQVSYPSMCELEDLDDSLFEFLKERITDICTKGARTAANPHDHFMTSAVSDTGVIDIASRRTMLQTTTSQLLSRPKMTDSPPPGKLIVVYGSSGVGKSTFMAQLCNNVKGGDNIHMLMHFCGISGQAKNGVAMLRRMSQALHTRASLKRSDSILMGRDTIIGGGLRDVAAEANSSLRMSAQAAMSNSNKLVCFFDAINQLEGGPEGYFEQLMWLDSPLPDGVVVVCSVIDAATVDAIRHRFDDGRTEFQSFELEPVDEDSRRTLISNYFGNANKKLSAEATGALLAKKSSSHPLWLQLACEELRVFGVFEGLSAKVAALPEELDTLVHTVINRVASEHRFGAHRVRDMLCFIYITRSGLEDYEVVRLLDIDDMAALGSLYSDVSPYLSPYVNGRLDFCHSSFERAIKYLFLGSNDVEQSYRRRLIANSGVLSFRRVSDEIPYQYMMCDDAEGLLEVIGEPAVFNHLISPSKQTDFIRYWHFVTEKLGVDKCISTIATKSPSLKHPLIKLLNTTGHLFQAKDFLEANLGDTLSALKSGDLDLSSDDFSMFIELAQLKNRNMEDEEAIEILMALKRVKEKAIQAGDSFKYDLSTNSFVQALSRAHMAMGRMDEAVALLEGAVAGMDESYGDYGHLLNSLALCYSKQGKDGCEKAVAMYQKVLVHDEWSVGATHPDYASTLVNIGDALTKLERYEEAQENVEKALELFKKSPHPHAFIAMWILSKCYMHLGREQEALGLLEKTMSEVQSLGSLDGTHIGTLHLAIGQSLWKLSRTEEAAESFEKGLLLHTERPLPIIPTKDALSVAIDVFKSVGKERVAKALDELHQLCLSESSATNRKDFESACQAKFEAVAQAVKEGQ